VRLADLGARDRRFAEAIGVLVPREAMLRIAFQ
jgi:hypothetical protein